MSFTLLTVTFLLVDLLFTSDDFCFSPAAPARFRFSSVKLLKFCVGVSPCRDGGAAAGAGSGGGRGSELVPPAGAGAQEAAGPGPEQCGFAALRGGRAEGGPAGHCPADHSGHQVSDESVPARSRGTENPTLSLRFQERR